MEIAINEGLLASGYGNGLLSRIAGVSRFLATEAAGNGCQPRAKRKLTAAQ